MSENKTTIGYNGHSADLDDEEEAGAVTEDFVRDAYHRTAMRNGQAVMPGTEVELLDNASLVRQKVKEIATLFQEGTEVTVSVKIPSIMECKTTIKVDIKPAKPEKDEK